MPFDGENFEVPEMTENQCQWYDAMTFCDHMEMEARHINDEEVYTWWKKQSRLCYAKIQMGLPYHEKYQGVV